MRPWITFILLTLFSFPTYALTSIQAEARYQLLTDGLNDQEIGLFDGTKLSVHHKKILMDSLWDYVANPDNTHKFASALKAWKNLDFNSMPLADQIRLFLIGVQIGGEQLRLQYMKASLAQRIRGKLDNRSLIIIFNHEVVLRNEGLDKNVDEVEIANIRLKMEYDSILAGQDEELNKTELKEIFSYKAKGSDRGLLYLVCRSDRDYPCLFILKNRKGEFHRDSSYEIWSLPALAKSKTGLLFHFENGHTPSGLYAVDSVMPNADRQVEYGKNRRLILRMLDKNQTLKMLPASQSKRFWWRQVALAMELGRENLRIHGTGKMNTEIESPHPEFVASFGCIKLREGIYSGTKYNDQRELLNALLKVQGLKPLKYNETLIKAYLMVLNIPGHGPVSLWDVISEL